MLLGIRDRCVRHALLVAALINTQVARILLQRLAKADYHAVAEDREDAVHERLYLAVHLDVLLVQELDDRLTYCHFGFTHFSSSLTRVYNHSLAALSAAFVFDGFSVARPAAKFLLTSWRLAPATRFSSLGLFCSLFYSFFTTFSTFETSFPAFRPIRRAAKSSAVFSNIPLFCIFSAPASGRNAMCSGGAAAAWRAAARRSGALPAAGNPCFLPPCLKIFTKTRRVPAGPAAPAAPGRPALFHFIALFSLRSGRLCPAFLHFLANLRQTQETERNIRFFLL